MNEIRKKLPMLSLPNGANSGRMDNDYVDYFDVPPESMLLERADNVSPLRVLGALCKRRPVLQRRARHVDYSDKRIVNMVYVPAMNVVIDDGVGGYEQVTRDVLLVLYDGDEEMDMVAYTYDGVGESLYDSGNWENDYVINPVSNPTATGGDVYPYTRATAQSGLGLWKVTNAQEIKLAMGPYEHSVPMEMIWANFGPAAPIRKGFFALPNSVTTLERTAKVAITQGPRITPEKPRYKVGANFELNLSYITSVVDRTYPDGEVVYDIIYDDKFDASDQYWPYIAEGDTGNIYLRRTGRFWMGSYKIWMVPVKHNGEEGPPCASVQLEVPQNCPSAGFPIRGVSAVLQLYKLSGDVADLRPDIQGFNFYGKYEVNKPHDAIWTRARDDYETYTGGFGFAVAPTNIPPSFITYLPLQNQQFLGLAETGDPEDRGSVVSSDWMKNPQFNSFISRGGEWMSAERSDDDVFRVLFNQLYPWQYALANCGTGGDNEINSNFDDIYIEIEGYAGIYKVTKWQSHHYGEENNKKLETYLQIDTNMPAGSDKFKIRFVCPWDETDTDEYSTLICMTDPELWDQSLLLNWREDADEDYDLDYPSYYGHGEIPIGIRFCWNYWQRHEHVKNVLRYTTQNYFGIHETSRFRKSRQFPGEITGACAISDTRIIVSTTNKSYVCDFVYQEDNPANDRWHLKIVDELNYGNKLRDLYYVNRYVIGIDHKAGPWRVALDPSQIREDITPVGEQQPMMNMPEWRSLVDTLGAEIDERLEYCSVSYQFAEGSGIEIKFFFPKFTGQAGGEAKNNISIKSLSATGGLWYSYYEWSDIHGIHSFWSKDYGTAGFSLLDACRGPAGGIIAHKQNYISGFSDTDDEEQDQPDAADAENIKSYIRTLIFRLQDFPVFRTLNRIYSRVSQFLTNTISYSLQVTPYRDESAESAVTKSGQTGRGDLRGFNARGNAWKLYIYDESDGTFKVEEQELFFRQAGGKR